MWAHFSLKKRNKVHRGNNSIHRLQVVVDWAHQLPKIIKKLRNISVKALHRARPQLFRPPNPNPFRLIRVRVGELGSENSISSRCYSPFQWKNVDIFKPPGSPGAAPLGPFHRCCFPFRWENVSASFLSTLLSPLPKLMLHLKTISNILEFMKSKHVDKFLAAFASISYNNVTECTNEQTKIESRRISSPGRVN